MLWYENKNENENDNENENKIESENENEHEHENEILRDFRQHNIFDFHKILDSTKYSIFKRS